MFEVEHVATQITKMCLHLDMVVDGQNEEKNLKMVYMNNSNWTHHKARGVSEIFGSFEPK